MEGFFNRYVNLNGELSQNLLPYSDMKTFGLILLDFLEEEKRLHALVMNFSIKYFLIFITSGAYLTKQIDCASYIFSPLRKSIFAKDFLVIKVYFDTKVRKYFFRKCRCSLCYDITSNKMWQGFLPLKNIIHFFFQCLFESGIYYTILWKALIQVLQILRNVIDHVIFSGQTINLCN